MKEHLTADIEQNLLDYVYANPLISFFQNWGHRQIEKYLQQDGLILDLGCGRGEHLNFANPKNKYIGIDNSLHKLKSATLKFNAFSFIDADASRLPFKDGSFACVISVYSLEHVTDLGRVLSEVSRVLKRGGIFALALPTEGWLFKMGRNLTTKRFAEKRYNLDYNKLVEQEHLNDIGKIIELIKRHFQVVSEKGCPFPFRLRNLNISYAVKSIKR